MGTGEVYMVDLFYSHQKLSIIQTVENAHKRNWNFPPSLPPSFSSLPLTLGNSYTGWKYPLGSISILAICNASWPIYQFLFPTISFQWSYTNWLPNQDIGNYIQSITSPKHQMIYDVDLPSGLAMSREGQFVVPPPGMANSKIFWLVVMLTS